MNEKRSADLAEMIHERKLPNMCRSHPRLVFFDTKKCPVCAIEPEVSRRTVRMAEKEFLARNRSMR